jgi:hypothetical protein
VNPSPASSASSIAARKTGNSARSPSGRSAVIAAEAAMPSPSGNSRKNPDSPSSASVVTLPGNPSGTARLTGGAPASR